MWGAFREPFRQRIFGEGASLFGGGRSFLISPPQKASKNFAGPQGGFLVGAPNLLGSWGFHKGGWKDNGGSSIKGSPRILERPVNPFVGEAFPGRELDLLFSRLKLSRNSDIKIAPDTSG